MGVSVSKKDVTSKKRVLFLFLLLVLLAALFINKDRLWGEPPQPIAREQVQKPGIKSLKLDDELKAEIAKYFSNIEIKSSESSIAYATRLDHATGRKLLMAGKLREAYPVYQKVLKISFNQGSLMGVGLSLGVLSNIMHEMRSKDESIRLAFMEYKVGKALGKRFEYGVTEQRIAILMEQQSRSLAMSWRLRASESLKGTPYHQNYVGLLVDIARDLSYFRDNQQALETFELSFQAAKSLGNSVDHRQVKLGMAKHYMVALIKDEQYQKAIDIGKQAIANMAEDIHATALNYNILYQLGEAHNGLKLPTQASTFYAAAYGFYEDSRANALGDKARAKIDNSNWSLINRLVDSYINQKDYFQALAVLENNKARTLSDIEVDANQKSIYSELTELSRLHAKQRSAFFNSQIKTLEQTVKSALYPEPIERMDKVKEYRLLRDSFEKLLDRQQEELTRLKISSEIRDVAISQTISAKQIKQLQSKLSPEQADHFFVR